MCLLPNNFFDPWNTKDRLGAMVECRIENEIRCGAAAGLQRVRKSALARQAISDIRLRPYRRRRVVIIDTTTTTTTTIH